jgi:hypothetical protein
VIEEKHTEEIKILAEDLAFFDSSWSENEKNPDLLKFSSAKFRTEENAISNLFADIVLTELEKEETEVVLLNGGTFRSSGDWNGIIKIVDLMEIFSLTDKLGQTDKLVQLKVRGKVIKAALEHSVSGEMEE